MDDRSVDDLMSFINGANEGILYLIIPNPLISVNVET